MGSAGTQGGGVRIDQEISRWIGGDAFSLECAVVEYNDDNGRKLRALTNLLEMVDGARAVIVKRLVREGSVNTCSTRGEACNGSAP